ncbi:MAG: sterol desaturase family protein [Deltaproteobacteria bacterium]|nr:sterol desaturase family protein [Deltaproteobacteria bacterium]
MYGEVFHSEFVGYAGYLWREVTHPHWGNYFYWLLALSIAVYAWELLAPWRRDQPRIRKDFWLDGFYMFFNFFLFNLVGFAAVAKVTSTAFGDFLGLFGVTNLVALHVESLPGWSQLLLLFVVRDFVHWNVHRLLHRVPLLWEFHKVHHSVEQMGFAAHLRYHWVETVVYRTLEFLPLAMIGFGLDDFLVVHLFGLLVGHLNHANIVLPIGPLRYLLNNPQMHIWHHARDLPPDRPHGLNYGITLSLWDYLFGTAFVPRSGRDIPLGFPGLASFPTTFLRQIAWPATRSRASH